MNITKSLSLLSIALVMGCGGEGGGGGGGTNTVSPQEEPNTPAPQPEPELTRLPFDPVVEGDWVITTHASTLYCDNGLSISIPYSEFGLPDLAFEIRPYEYDDPSVIPVVVITDNTKYHFSRGYFVYADIELAVSRFIDGGSVTLPQVFLVPKETGLDHILIDVEVDYGEKGLLGIKMETPIGLTYNGIADVDVLTDRYTEYGVEKWATRCEGEVALSGRQYL